MVTARRRSENSTATIVLRGAATKIAAQRTPTRKIPPSRTAGGRIPCAPCRARGAGRLTATGETRHAEHGWVEHLLGPRGEVR